MTGTIDGRGFGAAVDDCTRHRAGFPESVFVRLRAHGIGTRGQRVLDLGTGTGSLARGFARAGCRVLALDPDARMVAAARELDRADGVRVASFLARAEAPPLAAGSLDVVAAGQCWHWFERPKAARAARNLLRPGGLIAIVHFDWLPLAGNVVAATERLIEAHNPAWRMGGGSGMYPAWMRDLAEAGFGALESFTYDLDVPYTHAAWRGRIRASAGVGASLAPDAVRAFDAELAAELTARFPTEPLAVPHRVFAALGTVER